MENDTASPTGSMRNLIDLVEASQGKTAYRVERHSAPNSGQVLDHTTIRASNQSELKTLIKRWMEDLGLDPEDEDDLAHITWRISN